MVALPAFADDDAMAKIAAANAAKQAAEKAEKLERMRNMEQKMEKRDQVQGGMKLAGGGVVLLGLAPAIFFIGARAFLQAKKAAQGGKNDTRR